MTKKKFRIHVLGVPHTVTNEDFVACAYTQKALKFCKMMKNRGHHLMHYGHEKSNPDTHENISVISSKEWDAVYGKHDYKSKFFTFDTNDAVYQTFYKNAIREISKRKKPNDIILPFWGSGVRPVCDAHQDLNIIEPGIGYAWGHWAPYKIFESYAILHAYQGLDNVKKCLQGNYDIVIPNYFDLNDFEYESNKDDYFLFLGRVYSGKGIHIAMQVTKAAGVKLKVAGQPDEYYENYDWPDHVEFVGYAGVEERNKLMKHAKGSLLPSQYLEPFGGVQIENLLAGTPTITSDWGAFTENNIESVTGYRCRTFEDYVRAIKNVQRGKIKSNDCRKHGEKFSLEKIAPMYEDFFEKVTDVSSGKGWYEMHDESLYTKEYIKEFNSVKDFNAII
jgi:glycosyltransferase involved in cell wall biosynthesis